MVLTVKQQAAALCVLAFFCIAILCADSMRIAARPYLTINSRGAERNHAPIGQRKALKRTVCIEDTTPPSASYPSGWRYLSVKQRRMPQPVAELQVNACEIAPVQKVSTNLFLSVLNL